MAQPMPGSPTMAPHLHPAQQQVPPMHLYGSPQMQGLQGGMQGLQGGMQGLQGGMQMGMPPMQLGGGSASGSPQMHHHPFTLVRVVLPLREEKFHPPPRCGLPPFKRGLALFNCRNR